MNERERAFNVLCKIYELLQTKREALNNSNYIKAAFDVFRLYHGYDRSYNDLRSEYNEAVSGWTVEEKKLLSKEVYESYKSYR